MMYLSYVVPQEPQTLEQVHPGLDGVGGLKSLKTGVSSTVGDGLEIIEF